MRYRILMLTLALLATACATTNNQSSGPSLEERINEATKNVSIIQPASAQWCAPEKSCTYMTQIYCSSSSDQAAEKCQSEIQQKVIQSGGDTFVVQDARIIKGFNNVYNDDYYRIYGQIYRCTDKYDALHKEYMIKFGQPGKPPVIFQSKNYFDSCVETNKCEYIDNESCSSIRATPFSLCYIKFNQNHQEARKGFNTVVIKRELFNNLGSYRMFVDLYKCK